MDMLDINDINRIPKIVYNGIWQPILFSKLITDDIYPNVIPGRYIIYSNGVIYDMHRDVIQYHQPAPNRYYYTSIVTRDGKRHDVGMHVLVARAFCPMPEISGRVEVNHLDGDKSHNEYYNLENCSSSQNRLHAYRTGLRAIGENHDKNTKLNDEQVRLICSLLSQNVPINKIAVTLQNEVNSNNIVGLINAIKKRRVWTHISKDYNFNPPGIKYTLTEDQIHQICKIASESGERSPSVLLNMVYDTSNLTERELLNMRYTVSNILNGKRHRRISSQYNL